MVDSHHMWNNMDTIKLLTDIKTSINKQVLIQQFQERVWNDQLQGLTDEQQDRLSELAYDLDFYEPDATNRAEDPAYYGDEKLIHLIDDVLVKLQ